MASDELPVGNTSSPLRPRFPGDRGKGADIPLESMPKPADNPPGTMDVLDIFPPQGPSRSLKEKPMPPAGIKQIRDSGPLTLSGDDLERGYQQSISGDDLEKNYKPTNPLAPTIDLKTGLPKGWSGRDNWYTRATESVRGVPYVGPPAAWIMNRKPSDISPAWAMPPGASILGRAALNAGGGALEAGMDAIENLVKGKQQSPLDVVKDIGNRASMNAALGAIIGEPIAALGKLIPMTKSANALRGNYPKDVASSLAQNLEQNVPALKGSDSLYDMVYGSGRDKVKEAFAKSLETIKQNAKGKMVAIPEEVAADLKLGSDADALQAMFNQRAAGRAEGLRIKQPTFTPGMREVDAADLAEKLLGYGKKEPRGYRAAVDALDAAGIGDPAARQAYKYYTGMSNYIDKSGAFKGENFDPQKLVEGASKLKNIDELRRRGIGSATEGPLANLPQRPDISSVQNPLAGHGWIGGMLGGGLGTTIAHGAGAGPLGHGIGFLAGAGLANALPKEIVTRAPISQGAQNAAALTPGALATLVRAITGAGSTGQ